MWPPDDVGGDVGGLVNRKRALCNRVPDTRPLTQREEAAMLAGMQNVSTDAQAEGQAGESSDDNSPAQTGQRATKGGQRRFRKRHIVERYLRVGAGGCPGDTEDDDDHGGETSDGGSNDWICDCGQLPCVCGTTARPKRVFRDDAGAAGDGVPNVWVHSTERKPDAAADEGADGTRVDGDEGTRVDSPDECDSDQHAYTETVRAAHADRESSMLRYVEGLKRRDQYSRSMHGALPE
eukprot:3589766-Rhodomonas_salina.1